MGLLNNPTQQSLALARQYDDSMMNMGLLNNPAQRSLNLARQYDNSMMRMGLLNNPVQNALAINLAGGMEFGGADGGGPEVEVEVTGAGVEEAGPEN